MCEVCGDGQDRSFEIILAGRRHLFDTFECAMHALSTECEHCRRRTVAQGIEPGDRFCSARCARESGACA